IGNSFYVLYPARVSILGAVGRGRRGRAGCLVVLAAASLVGCGNKDTAPDPAYQRGYKAGQGAEVLRLIKQQGELPIAACDDILKSDKKGQGYSFDDAAVYKQGCLDAVRAEGISPSAGF
ncbi:MAG TPA: hypothetical protein VGC05_13680, partial [Mycobacterium sp.]